MSVVVPMSVSEAVQALWPGTQVTIGPVIENGFFYDFAKAEPFEPDDIPRIEKKMAEIIARNAPFTKEFWSRDEAKTFFRDKGELFKIELVDAIPEGEDLKIYKQGEWLDLCRGRLKGFAKFVMQLPFQESLDGERHQPE